jgi:hypothetical protein
MKIKFYDKKSMCLITEEGELSSSCPGHFTPGTHWIRGSVGPIASLDAVE